MKVLLINKYNYLKGGADTVFFHTKKLLEQNGHSVVPFCTRHPKNIYDSEFFVDAPEIRDLSFIKKIVSIRRFFWNKDAQTKLEELILREKPDVAHLHNIFNGLSLSILPVLKKHNIPVVITLHDTRFICPSSYFNLRGKKCDECLNFGGLNCGLHKCYQDSFLNSWMCAIEMFHKEKMFDYNKYIDKYIFVSNRYKSFHSIRHSYFQDKGVVLYNFLPTISSILPNNKKGDYLLYYGRVTVEKGIMTLVEAMKSLPEYKLKIVGTGPLVDKISNLNLPNIELLGFKSGTDLWSIVENSSYVIVPSEWEENNPLTVIEAYAYGKPVIGANIGGIPEIVKEKETGFVFESKKISSLISKIKEAMLLSNEEYVEMSKNARNFADINFNDNCHFEKLLNIYKSVLK